jgi:hypothetical protein
MYGKVVRAWSSLYNFCLLWCDCNYMSHADGRRISIYLETPGALVMISFERKGAGSSPVFAET